MTLLAAGAGLVLAVAAWVNLSSATETATVSVGILAALGAVSVAFPLRFYHDGDVQGFNLTSSVLLTTAMLAPDPGALLSVALMAAIGFSFATRSAVKAVFNTAQVVVSASVALTVANLVHGGPLVGDVLAPRTMLAVAVGAAAFGIMSALLVSELIHRFGGNPRAQLLREILGPALWMMAGDYFVAILLTVLADRSPAAIVLALPMFAGLLLGYRGYASDREAGRQAQALHGTSRQLLDGALDDAALEDAVAGLRDLFGAERAVLAAGDEDGPDWIQPVLAEVHRTGQAVSRTGEVAVLAAPVRLEGRVVGALAVSGRRGLSSWGPSDLDLLSTVAGEIAATLRTRRLLSQVEEERARLAAETSKLTDVLSSASDGIVVLDADGKVDACNPAMIKVLGLAGQLVAGLQWQDILRLEDEDGAALVNDPDHPLVRALTSGARVEGATAGLRRPDGTLRWLRCSAAPVLSDGEPDGVVLVAVDQTREREVDQLRSDFIATVSHELRTPLTPLSGFLGVMRDHGSALDDDRRAMMIGAMEKQVGRLSDLISDLLQVAELERGLVGVRPEPVDVEYAVAEILELEVASELDRERIVLELEPVRAYADRDAVRRILRALVSNGFKHTGGRITIRATADAEFIEVEVEDEGPGIPETERDVIFEPFRRLGNHLHRTQGPGLGLSVARSLAEALDGSLVVDAAPGGGALFRLRLPAASPRPRPIGLPRIDQVG